MVVFSLLLILAQLGQVSSVESTTTATPQSQAPEVISEPVWIVTSKDAGYPLKALNAEVGGEASLACVVVTPAGNVKCVIKDEYPKGYGFGDMAVKIFETKRLLDLERSHAKVGSVVLVLYKFTIN